MAAFGIEDAAFSGVGLLVRKPLAALAWALVYAAFLAIVFIPFAGAAVAFVTSVVKMGGNPAADDLVPLMGGITGLALLLLIGSLVVGAVVSCAVFRAILTPADSAFAYMRLGTEELWVLLVNVVRTFVIFGVQLALTIPLGIIVSILTTSLPGFAVIFRTVGSLVVDGVVLWVSLRLILSGPMSFTERQFRLFESWTLTRGYGWSLLGVGVVVGVISLAVYLVAVVIGLAGGLAIWNGGPHPADIQNLLSQPPSEWLGKLAPLLTLIGGLVWVVAAILTPIFIAPWAHIYQRLQPATDIAQTFS